ncbi:MAG: hypothetical protein AAGF94_14645, partial [Pseudomonadota bacterium]
AALLRVTWDGTFSSDVSIGSQNLGGLGYRFSSLIDNQADLDPVTGIGQFLFLDAVFDVESFGEIALVDGDFEWILSGSVQGSFVLGSFLENNNGAVYSYNIVPGFNNDMPTPAVISGIGFRGVTTPTRYLTTTGEELVVGRANPWSPGNITIAAIPVPISGPMLLAGLGVLFGVARGSRKSLSEK